MDNAEKKAYYGITEVQQALNAQARFRLISTRSHLAVVFDQQTGQELYLTNGSELAEFAEAQGPETTPVTPLIAAIRAEGEAYLKELRASFRAPPASEKQRGRKRRYSARVSKVGRRHR